MDLNYRTVKKSKHFVQMWVQRYLKVGHVDDLPGKEKTRATSEKKDSDSELVESMPRRCQAIIDNRGHTPFIKNVAHKNFESIFM